MMDKLRRLVEAEENIVIDFQYALIDAMAEKGLTKEEFAKLAGVSKARVSQWLSEDANPTLKTVAKVFDALDAYIPFAPMSIWSRDQSASASEFKVEASIFEASIYTLNHVWVRDEPAPTNDNGTELESIAA